MTDIGFKYSIPSVSIIGNKNPKTIGYSSSYSTLKTYQKGIVSAAATSFVLTTVTVDHGLTYRPAFNAYFSDTLTGEYYQCMSGFEDVNFNRSGAEINVHAKSDNSILQFLIYNNNAATRNVDIYYEIFYEDLITEPKFFVG